LRGLASRAPFFHGGNASSLQDVVNFYDQRFSIGLTPQQKTDLVNFLNTL
jgi:cytochrome c peroxidase